MPSYSLAQTAFLFLLCVAVSTAESPAAVVRRRDDHGSRPAAVVRRHDHPGPDDGNHNGKGGEVEKIDIHSKHDDFGFGWGFDESHYEFGRFCRSARSTHSYGS